MARKYRMKILWKIISVLGIILLAIVVNAVFYLASYQYKTVAKIDRGESVNLYEVVNIMSLHAGICTMGSLYCPDAAYANFRMLTTREDTIYMHSDKWLTAKVIERFRANKLGRMAWNGDADYAFKSKEKNAAILLNYCYLNIENVKGKECYTATCEYTWSQPSKTTFNLGVIKITIFEQLFYELQKRGILHPYTLVCYYER